MARVATGDRSNQEKRVFQNGIWGTTAEIRDEGMKVGKGWQRGRKRLNRVGDGTRSQRLVWIAMELATGERFKPDETVGDRSCRGSIM